MEQTTMTDKKQTTTLMWTLADLTKHLGSIEAKYDRLQAGKMGEGVSASTTAPKKDVMVPTYWKADGKKIWY